MEESTSLTIIDATQVSIVEDRSTYSDDLARMGRVANSYFTQKHALDHYHQELSEK
jgi:hypothetical protein